jgi:hypothetical protein
VDNQAGAHPFVLGAAEHSTANIEAQDQNTGQSVVGSISDYERRVNDFNKKRPWPAGRVGRQSRVPSWSDPISARDILDEGDVEDNDERSGRSRSRSRTRTRTFSRLDSVIFGADGEEIGVTVSGDEGAGDVERRRRLFRHVRKRRHSFHDVSSFGHIRVLPPDRMRIDVGLSGQLLVMLRREEHLQNVLACLRVRIYYFKVFVPPAD